MTDIQSKETVFSRRAVLSTAGSGAIAALAVALLPGKAFASETDDFIKSIVGDGAIGEGGIKIDLPQIAENGNTVPITVTVDSPMTDGDYITDLAIAASGNPSPPVAVFHFTPMSGQAKAATRMRLAKTQDVVAVAKSSTGKITMMKQQIKVTIGGCGG